MDDWYESMLTQIGTYWAPATLDLYGNSSYGAPRSIICRWEDKQELFITAGGEEKRSQAKVFVNIDLEEGGYLYLGTSVVLDPRQVPEARIIQKFEKIPDTEGEEYERVAWL